MANRNNFDQWENGESAERPSGRSRGRKAAEAPRAFPAWECHKYRDPLKTEAVSAWMREQSEKGIPLDHFAGAEQFGMEPRRFAYHMRVAEGLADNRTVDNALVTRIHIDEELTELIQDTKRRIESDPTNPDYVQLVGAQLGTLGARARLHGAEAPKKTALELSGGLNNKNEHTIAQRHFNMAVLEQAPPEIVSWFLGVAHLCQTTPAGSPVPSLPPLPYSLGPGTVIEMKSLDAPRDN